MTPIDRLTAAMAREPHIANVNHGVYRDDLAAVLAVVAAGRALTDAYGSTPSEEAERRMGAAYMRLVVALAKLDQP